MPPWPTSHEVEPRLMMDPPPAAAIAGATAWAAKNWWRTFTAKRSSQYSGVTLSIGCRRLYVDKGHARLLGAEILDDRGADAAAAAGHEDHLVGEARIRGVSSH